MSSKAQAAALPLNKAAAQSARRIHIENGTLEAIKWLALLWMTGDHVNKYALAGTSSVLFDFGRMVMPLFGFVLAYNLARPGAAAAGVHVRVMKRLLIFGLISTPAFLGLGGLLYDWWPLNIMFTLLVTTASAFLFFERPGWKSNLLGLAVLIVGGSSVEFWWPAILMNLALIAWVKSGRFRWFLAALFAAFFLGAINLDQWALASFPLMLLAPHVKLRIPRIRWAFYAYYPALLYALWFAQMVFPRLRTG